MASLELCRSIIKTIIRKYAQYKPSVGEVAVEIVFDEMNDHYELIHTGWTGPYRVEGAVLHVDIRDNKVWIQHDGTETGIAEELVEAGIPRTQIVLAFKHPDMRVNTDYAVA
jgi:ketopantoate reductase